jgi:hypothetical protein
VKRPLTKQEKDWLLRGLKTLETGEFFGGGNWIDVENKRRKKLDKPVNANFLLEQIDELQVTEKCNCGEPNCHTVKFQNFEIGKSVAVVCYHTEDKRMLIIHINENNGKLAELEII